MKILLIGSTGMLGQSLYEKFIQMNFEIITISRSNSTYNLDLLMHAEILKDIILKEKPNIVINTAALINIQECEKYPDKAYSLNARLVEVIQKGCRQNGCHFIQISTDHYYEKDGKIQHSESDKIILLNEYAKTKYAGENYALTYENTLVVRTNIVGFRNKKNEKTFIEWVLSSLNTENTIIGYEDFFTSSIDVYHFADILTELIEKKEKGIINLASSDVTSKYEFINSFAKMLGKQNYVTKGTMTDIQGVKRANSLGLDVSKLRNILKRNKIPSSQDVIEKLIEKYKVGAFHELQ